MISQIEQERVQLGLDQKALCDAAKVHPTTYCRLKRSPGTGRQDTFDRLRRALDRLRTQELADE